MLHRRSGTTIDASQGRNSYARVLCVSDVLVCLSCDNLFRENLFVDKVNENHLVLNSRIVAI